LSARITILTTKSGWLVYEGHIQNFDNAVDVVPKAYTFNSLAKAIACLRRLMKPTPKPPEKSEAA
jgi:hypothetical protein